MNKLVIDAGRLIKYKRKVKGYSTQELAKLLGVSPGLINNIENAKTDTFNIDLLYKTSSVLNIPVTDIISYNLDLNSITSNSNVNSQLSFNVTNLIKSLIELSNNKNFSEEKLDMLFKKITDDINFYNKISSF